MKKLLTLISLFLTINITSQVKVIQFNANWNSANSVTWLSKLSDCKVGEIDIATNAAAKTKYKLVVVPTIIVFDHGEEVKRYQANIMMQIEVKLEDIQNLVDETVMNSFQIISEIQSEDNILKVRAIGNRLMGR